MQIDRARFLLLTASLAGGGCSSNPPTDPAIPPTPTETGAEVAVPAPPIRPPPRRRPRPPSPRPPAPPRRPHRSRSPARATTTRPPSPRAPSPRLQGRTARASRKRRRAANPTRTASAARSRRRPCSASTRRAASRTSATGRRRRNVRPRPFARHVFSPSTFNQCSPLVSQCASNQWNKLTIDDCQRLLSSVKDGKRQAMLTCMAEGCAIDSCTWSLR